MKIGEYNSNKLINFTLESLSDNLNDLIGPFVEQPNPCGCCVPCDAGPCPDDSPTVCPASNFIPNVHTH